MSACDPVPLLRELIGIRTDNPGGDEPAICRHLASKFEQLGADSVQVNEVPRESQTGAYMYARFGTPRLLINVHVDTVPPNSGWSRDPFVAVTDSDRVYGLGAADTKGAIAALIAALTDAPPRDLAVLLSGDEEAGSTCMRAFLTTDLWRGLERAIVCEPTARRVGVAHRGIYAYRATATGKGGHSSRADHMAAPVAAMCRLGTELADYGVARRNDGVGSMRGLCMNVASVDGGVAFNVIPQSAQLSWSVRPPPRHDAAAMRADFAAMVDRLDAGSDATISLQDALAQPPLEAGDRNAFEHLLADHADQAEAFVDLDFWTEAALLAEAGVDAVVVGPGDIAQAHAADEFVSVADLLWARDLFTAAISRAAGGSAT